MTEKTGKFTSDNPVSFSQIQSTIVMEIRKKIIETKKEIKKRERELEEAKSNPKLLKLKEMEAELQEYDSHLKMIQGYKGDVETEEYIWLNSEMKAWKFWLPLFSYKRRMIILRQLKTRKIDCIMPRPREFVSCNFVSRKRRKTSTRPGIRSEKWSRRQFAEGKLRRRDKSRNSFRTRPPRLGNK